MQRTRMPVSMVNVLSAAEPAVAEHRSLARRDVTIWDQRKRNAVTLAKQIEEERVRRAYARLLPASQSGLFDYSLGGAYVVSVPRVSIMVCTV